MSVGDIQLGSIVTYLGQRHVVVGDRCLKDGRAVICDTDEQHIVKLVSVTELRVPLDFQSMLEEVKAQKYDIYWINRHFEEVVKASEKALAGEALSVLPQDWIDRIREVTRAASPLVPVARAIAQDGAIGTVLKALANAVETIDGVLP